MTAPAVNAPRCTTRTARTAEGDVLTIEGDIDDDARLAQLAAQVGPRVVIDIEGISFINSVGVREWITLLDLLAKRGAQVTLRKVSEPMVRQMAMVIEASGGTTIESFHAPYACTACGAERSMILDVEPHRAALTAHRPPKLPCPSCGGEMEFDEFPNRYLSFLA